MFIDIHVCKEYEIFTPQKRLVLVSESPSSLDEVIITAKNVFTD